MLMMLERHPKISTKPSLLQLRNKARDKLLGDALSSFPTTSLQSQVATRSKHGNDQLEIMRKASGFKSSSSIVSADLFQKAMMAQFIESKRKGRGFVAEKPYAFPEQQTSASDDQSLSQFLPQEWNDASIMSLMQALEGSGPNNYVPYTLDGDSSATAEVKNPGEGLNAFTSSLSTSLSADHSVSAGFQATPDFNFGVGPDTNMDTAFDGDMDWVNFMRVSGFSQSTAEASTVADFGTDMGKEWDKLGF